MLNRTGRLAAAIVIMAGWLFLATPQSAIANRAFECGDTGPHSCCVDTPTWHCASGEFCCHFDYDPGDPIEPEFCGCKKKKLD